MWLNFLYFIFVIAISFGGNIHFGVITPRHIAAVFMFFIFLANLKIIYRYFKCFLGLYMLYLLFAFLSYYFANNHEMMLRSLLSQHFVALVACGSFIVYYQKNHTFYPIIVCFVVCGIVNSIICFLQFLGNPLGYTLGLMFISEGDSSYSHMTQLINGVGTYLLGIKGNAVHNGYYQMIMPFLLTYIYTYKKNTTINRTFRVFLYYIILFCFFLTLFLIQERSCILIAVILFCFYLKQMFQTLSFKKKIIYIYFISVLSLITLIYALPILVDYVSNSRLYNSDNSIRLYLIDGTFSFIQSHFLLGDMMSFLKLFEFPPHNILLNAFVEAGIIGFIAAFILYFKQINITYRLIKSDNNLLIGYAFLAYTFNSMLHNDSIISGDVIVWVLWGMVMCLYFSKPSYKTV